MSDILILGGTGFVSKACAKYLITRGYKIDILTRGKKAVDYDGFINHIICDRKNISEMQKCFKDKNYSYILDFSGYTKEDIDILFKSINNLNNLKRYVFCSSGAVYALSDKRITENSKIEPNEIWGDYGKDKLQCEKMIFDLIEKNNLHATILRPSYILGAGNNLYREAYFFDKIINHEIIPIPEDNVKVQFIDILDVVKNFECAMYNDNDCRAYNLSTRQDITFQEFIEACGKVVGIDPIIKKIPVNKTDVRRYFPFRNINFCLDITDLRENGLHSPMYNIEQCLTHSYKWYCDKKPQLKDDRMDLIDELSIAN